MPDPVNPSNNVRILELEQRVARLERALRGENRNDSAARPQQTRRTKVFPWLIPPVGGPTHFLHGTIASDTVRHKTKNVVGYNAVLNRELIARIGWAVLEGDQWWLVPHLAAGHFRFTHDTLSNSNTSRVLRASDNAASQLSNVSPINAPPFDKTFIATDPGLYIVQCFGSMLLTNNTASSTVRLQLTVTTSGGSINGGFGGQWRCQSPTGVFGHSFSTAFAWLVTTANSNLVMTIASVGGTTTSSSWAVGDSNLYCIMLELGRNKAITGLTFGGGSTSSSAAPAAPPAGAVGSAPDGSIFDPGMGGD